jgi:hypothetical protein
METKLPNSEENTQPSQSAIFSFLAKYALALAPALAYYLVYEGEKSYCAAFGLPIYFIEINLATVLLFASLVLGFSLYILFFIDSAYEAFIGHSAEDQHGRAAQHYAVFVSLIVLFAALFGLKWRAWIGWVLGFLLILLLDFQFVRFSGNKGRPAWKQLIGPIEVWSKFPLFGIPKKILKDLFPLFIFIYVSVVIAQAVGRASAYNQTDFLILSNISDTMVVKKYGDKMICCKYDPKTKSVDDNFFVIEAGADRNITFKMAKIGPMNLK